MKAAQKRIDDNIVKMEAIQEKAKKENRLFSEAETKEWDELSKAVQKDKHVIAKQSQFIKKEQDEKAAKIKELKA